MVAERNPEADIRDRRLLAAKGLTLQANCQTRGDRSGSVEILLQLMAYGADANNVATHFKSGNEPGVSKRNDEFTLLVIEGASSLAA